MIDISITINGRPATAANIKSAIERAVIEGIRKKITDDFRSIGTAANGQRLKVELKGTRVDNLTIHLSGPEELVEKAKKLLGK